MKQITFADLIAPRETRGQRSPTTVYATLTVRRLLRVAAREYFPSLSKCQQSRMLEAALLRYQAGAFRRSTGPACEDRFKGRVEEVCDRILRLRDRVPRARTIRRWL